MLRTSSRVKPDASDQLAVKPTLWINLPRLGFFGRDGVSGHTSTAGRHIVSTASDVAGATQQAAGDTASVAKEHAAQVGSTAATAASEVAGTAKEQAGAVAGEAASQAKDLLDQTKQQVSQQAGAATQKLGESVKSLAGELRSMGEGSSDGSGPAADLARTVAARGDAIADFLSSKEPGDLIAELRSFASRKPGTFLLGALAAGALAGRFVKGASSGTGSSPDTSASAGYPTPMAPAFGVQSGEPFALPTAEPLAPTYAEPDYVQLPETVGTPPATYGGAAMGQSSYTEPSVPGSFDDGSRL
jgi:hypothetical protein